MVVFAFSGFLLAACAQTQRDQAPGVSVTEPQEAESPKRALALEIYPDNEYAQYVFEMLFRAMDLHRTTVPFRGKAGPGNTGFNLDKLPLAVVIRSDDKTTDLLIANWLSETPQEFEINREWSRKLGRTVYVVRGLPSESLYFSSPKVGSFGYVPGCDYYEGFDETKYIRKGYLPKDHFLRKGLKNHRSLPIVGPEYICADQKKRDPIFEKYLFEGFNMLIHESYHVSDIHDQYSQHNHWPYDRQKELKAKTDFQKSEDLKTLVTGYRRATYDAISSLTETSESNQFRSKVVLVAGIIDRIKALSPEFWGVYTRFEKIEGGADFVSGQTMIDLGMKDLRTLVEMRFHDDGLCAAFYFTGLSGELAALSSSVAPWTGNAANDEGGIWERVLTSLKINPSDSDQEVVGRFLHALSPEEVAAQGKLVWDYIKR